MSIQEFYDGLRLMVLGMEVVMVICAAGLMWQIKQNRDLMRDERVKAKCADLLDKAGIFKEKRWAVTYRINGRDERRVYLSIITEHDGVPLLATLSDLIGEKAVNIRIDEMEAV